MQHDHDAVGPSDGLSPEGRVSDTWPRCPECRAPRIACCPICQTAGYDFPEVDPEFAVAPDPGAVEEPMSCGCGDGGSGHGGCGDGGCGGTSHVARSDGAGSPDHAGSPAHDASEPDALTMLICTTCDEPFVPDYLKRCEWCGHTFPSGFEYEPSTAPVEPLNARVVAVFFVLAAGVLALLGWLAYVM
ncbi:MAG: hypothetical protein U1E05_09075 [Patescibacteria group bacterium]|nr:hypothetical protein [Patescibacteria group bacterium]